MRMHSIFTITLNLFLSSSLQLSVYLPEINIESISVRNRWRTKWLAWTNGRERKNVFEQLLYYSRKIQVEHTEHTAQHTLHTRTFRRILTYTIWNPLHTHTRARTHTHIMCRCRRHSIRNFFFAWCLSLLSNGPIQMANQTYWRKKRQHNREQSWTVFCSHLELRIQTPNFTHTTTQLKHSECWAFLANFLVTHKQGVQWDFKCVCVEWMQIQQYFHWYSAQQPLYFKRVKWSALSLIQKQITDSKFQFLRGFFKESFSQQWTMNMDIGQCLLGFW